MKKGTAWSLAWNLSWTLVFSLLIPLMCGIWLDKRLGTTPWITLIGAALGILAATVGVARQAIRMFSLTFREDTTQQAAENGEEEPE